MYTQGHFGSNPGLPARPPAIIAQTLGHILSIPAERVSTLLDEGEAQLMRDGAVSRYRQGHLCSMPAERTSIAVEEEKARLERCLGVALLRRAEEQFWAECPCDPMVATLRRHYEALQRAAPHAAPLRAGGNELTQSSRDLGPGWAWVNSRSVPPTREGFRMVGA